MRKVLIIVCLISIVAMTVNGKTEASERKTGGIYPACGIVTEVDRQNDIVAFEDFNGNIWTFYGTEDWQVEDIIAVIFDDMGTGSIYDDEIHRENDKLCIRYCGHIGG